jgi:hypothetical protein
MYELEGKPLDGRIFVAIGLIVFVVSLIYTLSGSKKLALFLILGIGLAIYGLIRWNKQGSEKKNKHKAVQQRLHRDRNQVRQTNRSSFSMQPQQGHKYCKNCGSVVRQSDNFCGRCGGRQV